MVIKNKTILIKTGAKSLNDITSRIKDEVRLSKINEGNCTLFIKHTSASLIIQENADPSVLKDIENFLKNWSQKIMIYIFIQLKDQMICLLTLEVF